MDRHAMIEHPFLQVRNYVPFQEDHCFESMIKSLF
jgi:hypothetical protein